ncbi:MAG TPA: hypothetical protein VFG69_18820, partial [Nannocystaceae bacterium]|nr:hypothetical protein [Nannocystaceae bacterium]
PAALWAALPGLGAAVALSLTRRTWLQGLVLCALVFGTFAAGAWGARFEAAGAHARGETWGGPILGIHPFQTTAVMIDGYGPFDLPINDYVEPVGTPAEGVPAPRGYQPEELAVALELALHRIAEVHFADGPARARRAFARATAGAVVTSPVQERLDRPANEGRHERFWVSSGTTGQRSRVEFVCPGRRGDPRGPQPDSVMSRMCPDKYANEASAGLGVTGRWPGYVEYRGNERLGLGQLFGWTRSDDAIGRAHVRWEVRIGAWILLVLALAAAWPRGARATASSPALRWLALAVAGLFALVVVAAAVQGSDFAAISAFLRGPSWASPWDPSAWTGALVWPAALGVASWLARSASDDPVRRDVRGRSERTHGWLVGAFVIAMLLATDLEALRWAVPDVGGSDDALAFETFVAALADRVEPRLGLRFDAIEAIVGALVGSVLALACLGILHVVGVAMAAVLAADRPRPTDRGPRLGMLACAVLSAALVVSRKTEGGSSLIPMAIGAALVLGSTLDEIRRRGPAPRRTLGLGRRLALCVWIALGLALAVDPAADGLGDPVTALYAVIGLVAVLLPIVALAPDGARPGSA